MAEGIVDTSEIFIYGTHIKAHANRNKKESAEVMDQAFFYTEKMTKEINKDREKRLKNLKRNNHRKQNDDEKKKYDRS